MVGEEMRAMRVIAACFVGAAVIAAAATAAFLIVRHAVVVADTTPRDVVPKARAAPPAPATAYDAARATASVRWTGPRPEQHAIPITEPACVGTSPVLSERHVVGADGALPHSFVWAGDGPHRKLTGYASAPPFVLQMRGCMYAPHVFGLRVGQTLTIANRDPVTHRPRARPAKNSEFGQVLRRDAEADLVFHTTERAIPLYDERHSWMSATAFVLDHPFFGTTGPDGVVEIKGLPAGDYVFKVWHEQFRGANAYETETKVSLKEGEAATQQVALARDSP
jgi:hypothetical protein